MAWNNDQAYKNVNSSPFLESSTENLNPQGFVPEQGASAKSSEGGEVEEDEDIPRIIFYTRVLNLVLGVLMIVVSLLSLLTTNSATTGVLCCYVVVFACLLCCFESGLQVVLRVIALNFGFMYSAKARSIFMIFVGTILFSFSLFGKIIGCLMLANAGFNMFALFKYPGFEDAQRDRSQNEIKDYLKENPAFAQTFASAGASMIASNPNLAMEAGKAVMSSNTNAPTNK